MKRYGRYHKSKAHRRKLRWKYPVKRNAHIDSIFGDLSLLAPAVEAQIRRKAT